MNPRSLARGSVERSILRPPALIAFVTLPYGKLSEANGSLAGLMVRDIKRVDFCREFGAGCRIPKVLDGKSGYDYAKPKESMRRATNPNLRSPRTFRGFHFTVYLSQIWRYFYFADGCLFAKESI